MNEIPKQPRALRNVTVTFDPVMLKKARIRAAESDLSVSRYFAKLVSDDVAKSSRYEQAMRSYLGRGPVLNTAGGPYPKRDEIYDRWERNERSRIR